MEPIIYKDIEPNTLIARVIYSIAIDMVAFLFIYSIFENFMTILPIWAKILIIFLSMFINMIIMYSFPILRIKITTNSIMISDNYYCIYSYRIPCRDIVGVMADSAPIIYFMNHRFGKNRSSMYYILRKILTLQIRKDKLIMFTGSMKGMTLIIQTTRFNYIISCPAAFEAANSIRQVCDLAETTGNIDA
ncbi:MAG: hypothetical protein NTY09_01125 [bacterium]|nr:hypothetical protein [bacterium]